MYPSSSNSDNSMIRQAATDRLNHEYGVGVWKSRYLHLPYRGLGQAGCSMKLVYSEVLRVVYLPACLFSSYFGLGWLS